MNTLSEWSQKLDAYLSTKKLSKKQLAVELDISINTLEKWWRAREPSPEHAAKIQRLLDEDASTTIAIAPGENAASPAIEAPRPRVVAAPPPATGLSKQGKRFEEGSAVVSLLRTRCPFCKHAIDRFRNCAYCGQHFVWANVPVDNSS